MKNSFLFLFLAIMVSSFSCSSDDDSTEVNFIFGSYNGFCQGNCAHLFLYQDGNVYRDNINRFELGKFSFASQSESDLVDIATKLLDELPEVLLSSTEEVYGCPGCIDQGTLFLQRTTGSGVRSWYIDPMIQEEWPQELTEYVTLLRDELNAIIIY